MNLQHVVTRNKTNADNRTVKNIVSRNKDGSIRKKGFFRILGRKDFFRILGRKTGTKLTKNIPMEGLNEREGINNTRPETYMEIVIGERNDHRDNEPETHSDDKALLRRKD